MNLQCTMVTEDYGVGHWIVQRDQNDRLFTTTTYWLAGGEHGPQHQVMRVYIVVNNYHWLTLSGEEWRALEKSGTIDLLYHALLSQDRRRAGEVIAQAHSS